MTFLRLVVSGHLILQKILPQKLHEIEPSFFTYICSAQKLEPHKQI